MKMAGEELLGQGRQGLLSWSVLLQ